MRDFDRVSSSWPAAASRGAEGHSRTNGSHIAPSPAARDLENRALGTPVAPAIDLTPPTPKSLEALEAMTPEQRLALLHAMDGEALELIEGTAKRINA